MIEKNYILYNNKKKFDKNFLRINIFIIIEFKKIKNNLYISRSTSPTSAVNTFEFFSFF